MRFAMLNFNEFAFLTIIFASLVVAVPTVESPAIEQRALPVVMGLANTFGALAASTLTNTGSTAITGTGGLGKGDAGVWPGTAVIGFPPGTVSGTMQAGTTIAQTAQAACLLAYNNAQSIPSTTALLSSNLGGITLLPGVYTFPTAAVTLTGILTLNAAGNPKGQFIFQINTTFTAAAAAQVVLIGSAQACNVYFVLGSSATIGAAAQMQGNILAHTAITVANAASNNGTWCALNAAVTLIDNGLVAQAGTCPT